MKEIDLFLKNVPAKTYKKEKVLIKGGEPIEKIFFLLKGNVRQYLLTSSGEEINIHIFKPGSFFPIMLFIAKSQNRFYFETLTSVSLKAVNPQKVINFLKSEPDVLYDLTKRLSLGLNGMVNRLENTLGNDVRKRLLSLLAHFVKNFAREGKRGYSIQIPFTHKDLANWLGVSRETISRQMKSFERQNLISYNKRKIVARKNLI
ncbi:hypothetical protein A2715_05595 [Candidatus Woesebacteria bacterium RIFCSPHIGHO2_01_FULL_39_32]|uniref:HTH crp-type domain-containing protein n=1 Tax=Candidatus Woesebacteria bacterium RIFCSPLOWO2_01_FULL_39_25 TaxID=1802521 RepID=A0A1F8BLT7_9BACT|nr:MAG: hypothetical protein A2124_04040 [Candidatus Woesebacteria bacterium GWB1_37_5]OGM25493.1 MAG: hypothetical protein A2715_05595 [Candidatus Woesebacteria bacterium RIFCSPHIGHO2_01_FULL_39_32]OGM36773.1 MAG: hypothetical protein A3F01_00065 [Candidatus Woesebacteria bacterium RIFCSPHIGHO2_12_FULL_38_11]OGM65024.1 MAG: hypothetical protein A2893_05205 [Candidatus Woesebacteria bacterium RIFCSPLOWO2_01_FULL_39_25]